MSETIILPRRGKQYNSMLIQFANQIIEISKTIGFKVSSRGWCYLLEGDNLITKDKFDRIQKLINKCRKNGYLPIDFVAEEKARNFENLDSFEDRVPRKRILDFLTFVNNRMGYHHDFDYWESEKYYIQMLVEKVDLVTLFNDICKDYHIPIANSVGWSSILQRAEMVERFKEHEEKGCIPVLLYCGDFDPSGLRISDFLKKNITDIEKGTGWSPENLIVDRFGLNYDFIIEHELTWIDNLISGQGKRPDKTKKYIQDYIGMYGERKVEANAIVKIPDVARRLCETTIDKYVKGIKQRHNDKKKQYADIYESVLVFSGVKDSLENIISLVEKFEIETLDYLQKKE